MQEYFNCAMDIGEQMLICGAEVHRVEDSIERMCSALGATRTDVFIITTSMVVTVHTESGIITQTRRITGSGTDIERLHKLNDLSRRICSSPQMTVDEIRNEYTTIKNSKKYPFWIECISYIVVAGSFTIFFGGGFLEALVSMLIGCLLRFIVFFADKAELNKIFSKFICSLALSFFAFFAMSIGIISSIDNVIIGNIMLLIPGVGLTNSLRDLLTGDSIAGLLRMIEAILSALAIAAGYFLFIFLIGGNSL